MAQFLALLTVFALLAAPVQAKPAEKPTAAQAPLGSLNPQERALLDPYLQRGPVLLTEFTNRHSDLPAVIFAALVQAPAHKVAELIATPENYPRFMHALESIKVQSRHERLISYKWSWELSVFTLQGRNMMDVYPAPSDPARGYRIDVESTKGDLGVGRMVWRVFPHGPKQSIVVFSSRIDMRDSNYITEQLASGGASVNRTINVALAATMLLATKKEAERQAGTFAPPPANLRPLVRPDVDFGRLKRLLRRGDLIMLDLEGDTLHQVSVVGRAWTREEVVRDVMLDPEQFGSSLMHGSRASVLERSGPAVRFKWGIPMPLLTVGGQMMLRPDGRVVTVDGLEGSFSEGRWRFDTHRYRSGEAAMVGWARFDPADSAKFIDRIIGGNPHFSHGLAAATQLMIVRSLRARARLNDREARKEAAAVLARKP